MDKSDFTAEQAAPQQRSQMVFPQIARLELDELLTQLIERAQDVLETQGRLRALLSATQAVSEDLSLPHLLRRIVESACQLVGAQYGAIGVIGADGGLEEFIHVGMTDEMSAKIGNLPTGDGILGLLISEPKPLRLQDLRGHRDAVGFPAGHPAMHSFLGVPVRVRDRVFGNIYLTEKAGGRPFTAEDEELLVALAGAAAIAIDHAQLYADARARHQALSAAAELGQRVEGAPNPFAVIADQMRGVGAADLCVVVARSASGTWRVVAADGGDAGAVRGMVVRDPSPEAMLADLRAHGVDVSDCFATTLGTGSDLVHLWLCRGRDARPFEPTDQDAVHILAEHAAAALAQLNARRNAQLVELLQQRDAIAAEMNDQVVSRLFAAGLSLQSIAGRVSDQDLRGQLQDETTRLDEIIKTIRNSIFHTSASRPDA
ncbi:MAG TPA: GAF domain-containing protein [Mycobacteriales bacterium]|nr:GAF domain-containing protein [Mycobacteriales bacterium]